MDENKFYGNPCKRGHGGLRYKKSGACVECNKEASRRPEMKEHRRRYRQSERGKATERAYRASPERLSKQRERSLKSRQTEEGKRALRCRDIWKAWKMSPEEYDERIAEAKKYGCAICRKRNPERGFVIDHDRNCCPTRQTCGKCIRGVICHKCNTAIGMFGDDHDIIASALTYIREASVSGNKSNRQAPPSPACRVGEAGISAQAVQA